MANRHERRKTLATGEMKKMSMSREQIANMEVLCVFKGCGRHFRLGDGAPKGWTHIVIYADPQPVLNFSDIKDWVRDGGLCPEHTAVIDGQLLEILSKLGSTPAQGTA